MSKGKGYRCVLNKDRKNISVSVFMEGFVNKSVNKFVILEGVEGVSILRLLNNLERCVVKCLQEMSKWVGVSGADRQCGHWRQVCGLTV